MWVSDFTYVRSWAGFVYTAFIVDVFAQRILAWHCATTKHVELVATPLRIALWDRDRQGHTVGPDELICHSDAGSQYTAIRFTEHLALEGISPSIGSIGDGVCQTNGVTGLCCHAGLGLLRRPSNRMSKALRASFHLWVQRALPLPVGSSAMTAR